MKIFAVMATVLSLALPVVPSFATDIPAGPWGHAFYQPPSPLPPGKPGDVIWSRPLNRLKTMVLPHAARNELVLYRSLDPHGDPVVVSGTLAIPHGAPPKNGWPLITWTHGTTGLSWVCAPSLDDAAGPEHPYISQIRALLDQFVAAGYAVAASDYQGLGVKGYHPFLQGVPTAHNALDMVRAARQLEPRIGRRYAAMGHSQGGHADLFTAAEGTSYLSNLELVGDVAFAPGSHIEDWLDNVMKTPTASGALPYIVYVLQSYATTYPQVRLQRILTPTARAHLPDLKQGCMSRTVAQGYWSKAIAKDQFLPKPELGPFLEIAARNEPGSLTIDAPSLVLQGLADTTVPPAYTHATVSRLCKNGNVVEYRRYPGVDHDGVMESAAGRALKWIGARFAGDAIAGNCPGTP